MNVPSLDPATASHPTDPIVIRRHNHSVDGRSLQGLLNAVTDQRLACEKAGSPWSHHEQGLWPGPSLRT